MNYSRLLAAAALTSCILLPSAARAQSFNSRGLGNSGYGIFGNGSNLAGSYNGSAGYNFNRNYSFNQNQIGNFVQSAYTGSNIQPLGQYGLGANGAGNSNLSPYLYLVRSANNNTLNNYNIARPLSRQNGSDNGDWATNFKMAEKEGEEQLRAQQGDNNLNNIDWAHGYKQAEFEGEKEARRRAGEEPEPEYRDWATTYKDQEIAGEAKADKEKMKSKQRAANLRQAKELKELEADLSAGGANDAGKYVAPPALASGLQSFHGPGVPSQFKSMTHYYPPTGNRNGGGGGGNYR